VASLNIGRASLNPSKITLARSLRTHATNIFSTKYIDGDKMFTCASVNEVHGVIFEVSEANYANVDRSMESKLNIVHWPSSIFSTYNLMVAP
jgi:hypothetical protein